MSRFSIRNPYFVVVICLALVVIGVTSLARMPVDEVRQELPRFAVPVVVKADGLAAGKGVVICQTHHQAEQAAAQMFSGVLLGVEETEVVIEEFLDGEEVSFFALCDGKHAVALAAAQDHKRVGEGDTGPNTGGMGAYRS